MTKESIDTSNKAFKKANRARKRVMIAKDILHWLKEGRIKADAGSQVTIVEIKDGRVTTTGSLRSFINPTSESFQETIKTLPTCTVCAKGAIFLCTVARRNQVKNSEVPHNTNSDWIGNNLAPLLGDIFTSEQLRLIEVEFEGYDFECGVLWDERVEPVMKLTRFEPEERMITIMENIIKNKGTFIPVAM